MGLKGKYYFQQGNDPKHTAYIVSQLIVFKTPHQLHTPPQSPDMNPIEHLWDELGRRVRKHAITSKTQLKEILLKEWREIGSEITGKLVGSMQTRLKMVIHRKGKPTKY